MFFQVLADLAISASASGFLMWLLKEWFSSRLKGSIEHEYDKKIVTFKGQLKTEQELAILDIKTALAREATFNAVAHLSFAEASPDGTTVALLR